MGMSLSQALVSFRINEALKRLSNGWMLHVTSTRVQILHPTKRGSAVLKLAWMASALASLASYRIQITR